MIYIQKPQKLTFFQIEILENFFKRMMYYIGLSSNIDVIIESLPDGEFNTVAYFYNNQQDYDFCANFPNQFMAVHSAFGALFEMSVNSQYDYDSINAVTQYGEDYDDEDYEETQETDQKKEKKPDPKTTKEKSDLAKLGKIIDKILKNQEKNWPQD